MPNRFWVPVVASLALWCMGASLYAAERARERAPGCARPAALTPFERDGKTGFRNAGGKPIIAARFIQAHCFLETGIAAVADETGWAYIDRTGKILVRPFLFDNGPDYFAEGLARFVKDGRMGFFDTSGRVVIGARFEWVEPFSNGRARFCSGCRKQPGGEHATMTGGTWGLIDTHGAIVTSSKKHP